MNIGLITKTVLVSGNPSCQFSKEKHCNAKTIYICDPSRGVWVAERYQLSANHDTDRQWHSKNQSDEPCINQ